MRSIVIAAVALGAAGRVIKRAIDQDGTALVLENKRREMIVRAGVAGVAAGFVVGIVVL